MFVKHQINLIQLLLVGVVKVLSESRVFWKHFNSEIIERPSDNVKEIPEVRQRSLLVPASFTSDLYVAEYLRWVGSEVHG